MNNTMCLLLCVSLLLLKINSKLLSKYHENATPQGIYPRASQSYQ